jgi:molybdopterin molybdotransferase
MKARKLLDDCFLHDAERLKHEDAMRLIRQRVRRVSDIETVPLEKAAARIIAQDWAAPRDIPLFTNSAVDGYAFAHASLGAGETRLQVVMRAAAGDRARGKIGRGEAVRIFTGAPLPEGADSCIMQEDVKVEGDWIIVPPGLKLGANRRKAGEDAAAGAVVVRRGMRLRPQEIAAVASTGASAIPCYASLRAGLISTGNELVRPGEALSSSGVYDSNHSMLRGLLAGSGAQVKDLGIVADERQAVDAAIQSAARQCDIVFSTGGASRGEADHVVKALAQQGVVHGWQLAVKPGRPLAIGQIGDTVFMALPGNPVAVFVTFLLYGLPVLSLLQGESWREPQRYPLRTGFAYAGKKTGRREFWRGWIEESSEGPRLKKFERDGSGLISGLTRATGLIEVPEEVSEIAEGDFLGYIPFTEFGLPAP